MKGGYWQILFMVFSLFAAVDTKAQDQQGSVVIHTDPRLSVLLKKPHNVDAPTASVVKPRKQPRKIAGNISPEAGGTTTGGEAAATVPGAKAGVVSTATVNMPGAPATTPKNVGVVSNATVNMPAEAAPTPLPMENGHVAGWTPPVRSKARVIYSGKGYRVQIYNGPDRAKAIQVKTEFMRTYPGIRTYLSYVSPNFRVKLGDYRNRSDAAGMLREANSAYGPCMIVPDIITISTF